MVPFGYKLAGWTKANYQRTPGINQLGFIDEDDDDVFMENDWWIMKKDNIAVQFVYWLQGEYNIQSVKFQ